MLNARDPQNAYSYKRVKDFGQNSRLRAGEPKYYEYPRLARDGFIFPDGSLRFEFAVKKYNYRKRLEKAEKEA